VWFNDVTLVNRLIECLLRRPILSNILLPLVNKYHSELFLNTLDMALQVGGHSLDLFLELLNFLFRFNRDCKLALDEWQLVKKEGHAVACQCLR
jgi:hypothetical protein